jgi:hypothetical protein
MTEQKAIKVPPKEGLALLREPFLPHQISKLPKPTKAQTDAVRADFKKGIRCQICGAWHHPDVVHLDYVGHAALTDRLLDCDPAWNWEPLAFTEKGTPLLDEVGGMWIKLTVCNVTRYGYGHPDGKRGGDAIKEVIGDALRNAAMRFGAALDLWHKGDLHAQIDEGDGGAAAKSAPQERSLKTNGYAEARDYLLAAATLEELQAAWANLPADVKANKTVINAKDARKAELAPRVSADLAGDEIPY